MSTITTDDSTSSARCEGPYSGLPNKLVRAANGIDYAYRDTGPGVTGSVPLVLLEHFRGNLDNWGSRAGRRLGINQAGHRLRQHWGGWLGRDNTKHRGADGHMTPVPSSTSWRLARLISWGFSIGSFVAQQIALTRPAILRTLILASAAPQGAAGMHGWAPEVIGAVGEPETRPSSTWRCSSPRPRQAGKRARRYSGVSTPAPRPGTRRRPGRRVRRSTTRFAHGDSQPCAASSGQLPGDAGVRGER